MITAKSNILVSEKISIGSRTHISWDCLLMDNDYHKIIIDGKYQDLVSPISIGHDVWIACRVTILKGSKIAAKSVVGAGSVVTRSLDCENSIYAGIPAKIVKKGISWEV